MTYPLDVAALADLLARPGMDTRQWISYGLVDADTPSGPSVAFNDNDGNPLPNGILINVTLQPSGTSLPARVAMQQAGGGEGEYSPFGPGDEVLVALPEGDERAGACIIARFSNAHDTFPAEVAGVDVTQNNIAFKRLKLPYILETAASYLVRSALTGASFSMDSTGNVSLSDGEGNLLSLTQSVIILQESTGAAMLQIDPEKLTTTLQANQTYLSLDDTGTVFQSPTTLSVGTGGLPASGHAVTLEQVLNILVNWTYVLAGPTGSSTLMTDLAKPGMLLDPSTFPAGWITALTTVLPLIASPAPPTPTTAGGNLTLFTLSELITLALLAQLPDPAAFGAPTFIPGLGKQSFML